MQAAASSNVEEPIQSRPNISKSFSRYEPEHPDPPPKAKTFHEGTHSDLKEGQTHSLLSQALSRAHDGDVFVSKEADEHEDHMEGTPIKLPETFDELPIEIRSLTERFLESLSAKVHPTPLSIDALSQLFQDFYTRADAAIATHIAALSSRISREASPARRDVGASGDSSRGRGRSNSGAKQIGGEFGEQQMLTPMEINNRRKARRLLELKRTALEEAVERVACERVYDRLWRHRSTDDEERDSKLSSKTAALAVVGIGLKELHVNVDVLKDEARQTAGEKKEEIDAFLTTARENVLKMNEERYPLGKLKHLTAAHKSIVETLSHLFPSSSSADEVLPTLIYTLITTPAESINAVSNLYFIQRFRSASKMDGEASYCLVNLEAAISFLETVDLSSLRADEAPEGPPKSASLQSLTPPLDKSLPPQPLANGTTLDVTPTSADAATIRNRTDKSPTPSTSSRSSNPQERLSSLIKKADSRIEASRESFLNSADSAFDTINATLNDSFKFVFGRLTEQREREIQKQHASVPHDSDSADSALTSSRSPTIIPETLEDARKIVNPTPHTDDDAASETSRDVAMTTLEREKALFSDPLDANGTSKPADSKLLDLIGGRAALRDRSTDSGRSTSSSELRKRVAFAPTTAPTSIPSVQSQAGGAAAATTVSVSTSPPTASAMESMKSFGNSLNPLKGLGGIGFRGFGRQTPTQTQTQAQVQTQTQTVAGSLTGEEGKETTGPVSVRSASATNEKVDAGESEKVTTELKKLPVPSRRFIEMKDAKEMKIGEVEDLLKEYQRLVAGVQRVITSI
ncbi:MAG: hypothetical protein Q9165_001088 [Trypethelium subeluteriae]